ncbi:family 20 glycosylhydrolase [Spirosoma panaciterrae]|uniref:family 20 glycosylhydrolase n=1 Tax=Spirosoma panaciterrae TaxID=496058 RepID=UPI00036DBBB4|nr:family 20 glycosylhydrolase [Spirosoma panaciterrae]
MKRIKAILLGLLVGFVLNPATATTLPVVPYPQQVTLGKRLAPIGTALAFAGYGLEASLTKRLTTNWQLLTAHQPVRGVRQTITLVLSGQSAKTNALVESYSSGWSNKVGAEGYILVLNTNHKFIAANTETGLFYGLQSLKQLVRAGWDQEVIITDWPSFANRGIYDDISRGPTPKVSTIKKQIERLAELKVNSLSFYIEHVIQPRSYPDFAPADGKLTIDDIRELSAYAAQFHMQLVGSFQSFGHFANILSQPRYQPMGETSSMISPLDPKAKTFLASVITELCGAFNSPYFNVNCDETFDLGKGKSKAYVDSVGVAKYYADHIRFLYDVLKKQNKQLMMWGDIALQHEEILDLLPKDILYLTWEYGDQKSYDTWIQPFVKRKLQFIVCPGIVNSNRLFPDMVMAKGNINGFLKAGKQAGTAGVLTTIWDEGPMCFFHSDWYGVYTAAEKSWNINQDQTESFNERYERNAYGTSNGNYVKALFALMELRSIPLTYNLAEQIWLQKLLPDSNKRLIINNQDVPKIQAIIDRGLSYAHAAGPKSHKEDVQFLQFTLQQYQILMDSRLRLAQAADTYRTAQRQPNTTDLSNLVQIISGLQARYQSLKETYRSLWEAENQPYYLAINLKGFDTKINQLQALNTRLQSILSSSGNLPSIASIGLDIQASNAFYFQNWLLTGPFKTRTPPHFLYSEDSVDNVPPKPGDMAHYQGKTYRWQKYISQEGGIVDLGDYYKTTAEAVAYAYCSITTDSAQAVTALVNAQAVDLYVNGVQVKADKSVNQDETPFAINLTKGVNHILLKLPASPSWTFSFRLATPKPITNHKHKYSLNTKTSVHEAD